MNILFNPPGRRGQPQRGNTRTLRNAVVRNVSSRGRNEGSISVDDFSRVSGGCNCLILNVTRTTRLSGPRGRPISLVDIKPGMRIDAVYSDFMTASRPPQALAQSITVRDFYPMPVVPPGKAVQTGRIAEVNARGNYIVTGNPRNIAQQARFNVNRDTQIYNRNGRRISLSQLRTGEMVRVTHSQIQTMSLPPQSLAYIIQQM